MIYFIFGFILGSILFSIIFFQIAKNRYVIEQKKIDDSVYEELEKLNSQKQSKIAELNSLELQKDNLIQQKDGLSLDIEKARIQADEVAQAFYKEKMEQAESRFGLELENLASNYRNQKSSYEEEISELMQELSNNYIDKVAEYDIEEENLNDELNCLLKKINDLKSKISIAVEVSKRAELERTKKDFYRLGLTEAELQDVKRLKEIEPYLINKEVLAKLIWKAYYERSYTEMCNRVIGANIKIGIYKITNLDNDMAYIGQSVNIRERWREHIKAGLGIGSSNNRLYTSMKKFGPETFTFEILEECTRAQLNEKERYWINFFHTEDFGLNSNKGVSK